MNTPIFEQKDFDLFEIPGLEERMEILTKQLRPKFHMFGEELSGALSDITGETMFPHVAKHARRKTNPPNDSWIAFASNKRGYKMLPHFQITVWNSHVLIQWGIIYEAKNKQVFAENLKKHLDSIQKGIPGSYQWSKDHMKPEGTIQNEMTTEDFLDFSDRLLHNKNGEIMVGLRVPRAEALRYTKEEFYKIVLDTWSSLNDLHKLAN